MDLPNGRDIIDLILRAGVGRTTAYVGATLAVVAVVEEVLRPILHALGQYLVRLIGV